MRSIRARPLVLEETLEYHGFELGEKRQPLHDFSGQWAEAARHALALALAQGNAKHDAVNRNREAIETVRELYRRSGGQTPRLGLDELTDFYEKELQQQNVDSLEAFTKAKIVLSVEEFVPEERRKYLQALPSQIVMDGREVAVHYELEPFANENDWRGAFAFAGKIGAGFTQRRFAAVGSASAFHRDARLARCNSRANVGRIASRVGRAVAAELLG